MTKIVLLNKPFDVLCQFTDQQGRRTLKDYFALDEFYPAGRLDRDSEGLVVLTDDGRVQHLIANPRHKLTKTYWVQVEGEIDAPACSALCDGIELKDGLARAIEAKVIQEPEVWRREPPIRERQSIPTSWLCLVINEGRNRQVRRMTAAVGFPTLRLIRVAVGEWTLHDLSSGQWQYASLPAALSQQLDSPKWQRNKTKRGRASKKKSAARK